MEMSADNQIAIVNFDGRYGVKHLVSCDVDTLNPIWVSDYMTSCLNEGTIFNTFELALEKANEIELDLIYCEYGITVYEC